MTWSCSRRGGLGSQRKRLSLLDLLQERESLFLVLPIFLRHSMTLSLYVITIEFNVLYYLIMLFQVVMDFVFGLQHVTDLSGRETMVRITGKDYTFSLNRLI